MSSSMPARRIRGPHDSNPDQRRRHTYRSLPSGQAHRQPQNVSLLLPLPPASLLYRPRANVNGCYLETLLRQPDRVDACTAAQLDGSARLELCLSNHSPQFGRRVFGFPWRGAALIIRIPVKIEHSCMLPRSRETANRLRVPAKKCL